MSEDPTQYGKKNPVCTGYGTPCSGAVSYWRITLRGDSGILQETHLCALCASRKAHAGFDVVLDESMKPIDPKGDAGALKTPLGLIPPVAEKAMAEVLKLGAEKYGLRNWRTTRVKESTYVNAMLRHLNAFRSGEDLDPESGQSHLAHVMSGAAILLDAAANGTLERDLQLSEVKTQ